MARTNALTWAKSYYFFFYAAGAALIPFLVLYYEDLKLNGQQIGLLAGILPLTTLIAAPIWGGLADKTRKHNTVRTITILGAIGLALTIGSTGRFIWLLLFVVLYAFFAAPIMPLFDNQVMQILGGQKKLYGRLRLWGAVGWGLSGPVIGSLIERYGLHWSFWGYAGFMSAGMVLAWQLPAAVLSKTESFYKGIRTLVANAEWLTFLGLVFVGGMSLSIISTFLFLRLDSLGASRTLIGFSLTAATLSEIPMFFFADRLLRRISAWRLMSLAIAVLAIRSIGYSFLQTPWPALVIQLLHGPTFSAMWAAGISYADEIAPPGLGATAQGLFSGMLLGLGAGTGALLGGWLYDAYGPNIMFRTSSLVTLGALIFFNLLSRRATRKNQSPRKAVL